MVCSLNINFINLDFSKRVRERTRRQNISISRARFQKLHPVIAAKHKFAGGPCKQTYIQMHASMRAALHSGRKTCTRRTWGQVKHKMQAQAFRDDELVAVTGQGHASTIGYILYTSISTSRVGTLLTDSDLQAEGAIETSDKDFRNRWYKSSERDAVTGIRATLPDATIVYVLSFTFYSIIE
jgi:hypothetical protein